jgi:hypothetical protein
MWKTLALGVICYIITYWTLRATVLRRPSDILGNCSTNKDRQHCEGGLRHAR